MLRLFVALPLPDDARTELTRLRDARIPRARWVEPEMLHLTLRFIGEWPEERLPTLQDALRSVELHPSFEFCTGPRGSFGRPPHVLYVNVEPRARVVQLMQDVSRAVETCGVAPDPRPPHPHITLARLRNPPPYAVRRWREAPPAPEIFVTANQFTLYRSQLGPRGARYAEIATFPMSGEA